MTTRVRDPPRRLRHQLALACNHAALHAPLRTPAMFEGTTSLRNRSVFFVLQLIFCISNGAMQEFGLNGSTLVSVGRAVALLRDTLTLDNCVRALEVVAGQLRNLTILMPHGGFGELILDGYAFKRALRRRLKLCCSILNF